MRRGGEADLVVDDDVQRAADGVAGQLAEVERLLDDALAGEGGVAVDQQRHHACRGSRSPLRSCLARTPAQGHGVDELQVAGVEAQRQVDLPAVRR